MKARLGGQRGAVDDLVMLDSLTEEAIRDALSSRYYQDHIYTNIGPVLIAINPYKNMPENYTDAKIREYRGANFYELPPHIFATADATYHKMGESGSGKTETSKLVVRYISAVSGKREEVLRVNDRFLRSNPVFESFGNAKTVNNNNSSRFGKYMEILFDAGGDPMGGRVFNYLLEKCRVVAPAENERNFHIFYQVCSGANDTEKEQFCIYPADYYFYLNQSGCFDVDGIDDVQELDANLDGMNTLGFSDADRDEVFRVLSIILWLGNLEFREDNREVSSIVDRQVLDVVAYLLQVPAENVEKAICQRTLQSGMGSKKEVFAKPCTKEEAEHSRDTLAKALYSKMFDWVVRKINQSIHVSKKHETSIGILDIYGFEIFTFNSFEQLCINFVNERLQQIFIQLTLKAEQEEYHREGIPWENVDYFNNKPTVELIENKPGLISICDDCCNTGKTDIMFVQDLKGFFGSHQFIFCGNTDFTIRHYAAEVRYECQGFLTKNKDTLYDDIIACLKGSPNLFVKEMGWADLQLQEGQKKKPPTVGFTFKTQVATLMDSLMACTPHYCRCIKPNYTKRPHDINQNYTLHQVRYLGLLENVIVRRAGYANRMPFSNFKTRYGILVGHQMMKGDPKVCCETIMKGLGWARGTEYAMGKTKIFIRRAECVFHLEDTLERRFNECAIIIQRNYRHYRSKRFYLLQKAKAYDILAGKKERRRNSVDRAYMGDYLNFTSNALVKAIRTMQGRAEKILFADRIRNIAIRGKRSIWGKMKSLFIAEEDTLTPRCCMLTEDALYSLEFYLDETEKTEYSPGKTKMRLFYRINIADISSITMSPLSDNFYILHFKTMAGQTDTLQSCRKKTEFIGLLTTQYKNKTGQILQVNFRSEDTIVFTKKDGQIENIMISWQKDELCPEEKITSPKEPNILINICSGIPPHQVPEPFRPLEWDPNENLRPSLKCLYDFKGNGIDELDVNKGDVVYVVQDELDGWYIAEKGGKRGYLPSTYVEKIARKALNVPKRNKPKTRSKKEESPWEECSTATGEVYYFNRITQESSWDKPDDLCGMSHGSPSIRTREEKNDKCSVPNCMNKAYGESEFCVMHTGKKTKITAPSMMRNVVTQGMAMKQLGGFRGRSAGPPGPGPSSAPSRGPPARGGLRGAPGPSPGPATRGFPTRGAPAISSSISPSRGAPSRGFPTRGAPNIGSSITPSRGPSMPSNPQISPKGPPVRGGVTKRPPVKSGPSPGFQQSPPMKSSPSPAMNTNFQASLGAALSNRGRGGPTSTGPSRGPPVKRGGPPVSQPKKKIWQEIYDDNTEHYYYYNTETGESVWEKPPNF